MALVLDWSVSSTHILSRCCCSFQKRRRGNPGGAASRVCVSKNELGGWFGTYLAYEEYCYNRKGNDGATLFDAFVGSNIGEKQFIRRWHSAAKMAIRLRKVSRPEQILNRD